MNEIVQNLTGMGAMTEQVIATDLLISAKTGIRNYALAISECYTPELRQELTQQFMDAVKVHEQVTNYMVSKGFYRPTSIEEQQLVDLQTSQTALNLEQQL